MKNFKYILILGAVVVIAGAVMRIMKIDYSSIILVIGLILEVYAGVVYFFRNSTKDRTQEKI